MTDSPFNSTDLLGKDITTTYKEKELVLKNLSIYSGPLTRQLLPVGGIQTIYEDKIVIHTRIGYLYPTAIIYDGKDYKIQDFIEENKDLLNTILPS